MAELVPGLEDVTYNLQHKCKDMLVLHDITNRMTFKNEVELIPHL